MMGKPISVLLVEDSEADALLVKRALEKGGFVPSITRVENAGSLRAALQISRWDAVIADYNLPQFSGLDAFLILRESGLDLPFIIVSGSIGEEVAVEAMRRGVHDYVMKNNLARLALAVEREVREATNRSARYVAEEQLKRAERLRTVGELTASLVHDLRNPLNAILLSAGFLAEEDRPPEILSEYYSSIVKQVERVVAMSDDVMEFVRGSVRLSLESINPVDLVAEIVRTYAPVFQKDRIELGYAIRGDVAEIPTVAADYHKLWRVLQNLISNSKDAMKDGGKISLSVFGSVGHVVFEVSDSGGGIPLQIRDSLFDPFVTVGKARGTGLGLAIVKSIVDAHAGSVTFVVDEGVGTVFQVKIPIRSSLPLSADRSTVAASTV